MKKILIFLLLIVVFSTYKKTQAEEVIIIPSNSLRFRVIANSNSIKDFEIKSHVKNHLEESLSNLLKDAESIEETKLLLKLNLKNIENEVEEILKPYETNYKVDFGLNYFPKKIFKGVVYEAGNYDSLVISLGKGAGENWWCVLFPPLCLLEDNTNTSDVEYQFFISSIIKRFK